MRRALAVLTVCLSTIAPAAAHEAAPPCVFADAAGDTRTWLWPHGAEPPPLIPDAADAGGRGDLLAMSFTADDRDLVVNLHVRDLDAPRVQLANATEYRVALFGSEMVAFETDDGWSFFVDGPLVVGFEPEPLTARPASGAVDVDAGEITIRLPGSLNDIPRAFSASGYVREGITAAASAVTERPHFVYFYTYDSVPDAPQGAVGTVLVDLDACEGSNPQT